jgi:hypothetical protein
MTLKSLLLFWITTTAIISVSSSSSISSTSTTEQDIDIDIYTDTSIDIDINTDIDTTTTSSSQQVDQDHRRLFGADKYRWAAFGGANTYGLGAHLTRRFDAFPFLLSESIHNFGSVSKGVNYNAVCLQSTVTDEYTYDVILIDFGHVVDKNLLHLAQRLRSRYPMALIIFVKYWRPLHIRRVDTVTGTTTHFMTWLQQHGLSDWTSDDFQNTIQADQGTWYDDREGVGGMADLVQTYADAIGGFVVSIGDIKDNVAQGLVDDGSLFARPTLLSVEGHRRLAEKIKGFVETQIIDTSNVNTGTWNGGDDCRMWFTDGGCTLTFGDTASLVEYDTHHGKYALEFLTTLGGTFRIANDFDDSRELYISYIVSNTPGLYPDVLLEYGHNLSQTIKGTLDHVSSATEYPVTVPVGVLTPGVHTVSVTTIAGGAHRPFRLVAATFSNGITVPDEYSFAPMFAQ